MAKKNKELKKAKDIKLKQADRAGPSEATLLDLAQERGLFDAADQRERKLRKPTPNGLNKVVDDDNDETVLSPRTERILEAILWTVSLAMLHFTLDVLVHHQYATDIHWPRLCLRTARAWALFLLLFWPLHPHRDTNPYLLPRTLGVPLRLQRPLRQAVFFAISCAAGCYLVYISNEYGHLSIMKQAPPLGCLWIWTVIELDLLWALPSVTAVGAYMWKQGYTVS